MAYEEINSPLPPRRIVDQPVVSQPITEQPPVMETSSRAEPVGPTMPVAPKQKLPLIPILAVVLVGGLIVLGINIFRNRGGVGGEKTLTYWGLWEDSSVISGVIEDFEKENPGIKINYVRQQRNDYRSRLAGRLEKEAAAEDVPDIFRIHSSWLPMFKGKLAAMPAATRNAVELESDYYATVKKDLKDGGNYYALPLMFDQLAMFYNKDLLNSAQVAVPKSWWELQSAAKKLTVKDAGTGRISVAGAALGLTENVDHWSDIVGLMMTQGGADPTASDPANAKKVKDTLTFYTLFKTDYQVWDESLPDSTTLFANGKLGFYFGPSWRVFNIEEMKIPGLNYEIAPVPQLATETNVPAEGLADDANLTSIYWSTYWAEAVNNKSGHQKEAWKFLEYLSRPEVLEKLHTAQSQVRSFGEIYPRKSMAGKLAANQKAGVFLTNADSATSWYLCSRTFDDGLNDNMAKYFNDAINAMVYKNTTADSAWTDLKNGIDQLVQRYQIK